MSGGGFFTELGTISEAAMNIPRDLRLFVSAALSVLFLAGCVTHAPMSEMVIFHSPATHPAYENRHGFGVGLTVSPPSPVTGSLARLRYPTAGHVDVLNPRQFSIGWHTTNSDSKGRVALSLTLGALVAGLDGTVQLWRRNYFTAAVSVPGQVQLFLQHRTFNSPRVGAAVGLGARTDVYMYDVPSECMCRIEIQRLTSLGLRSFLIYRANGDEKGGMRMGLYAGYAPAIRQPTLNLSLTFGKF